MSNTKIPELLYKFLPLRSEGDITSYKGVLQSCIKGNLKFSSIHDLNDASEEFVRTDFPEISSSLCSILKKGTLDKEQSENLRKHVLLWKKFHPRTELTQELVDELLGNLPRLLPGMKMDLCSQNGGLSSLLKETGLSIPDAYKVSKLPNLNKLGKSELFSIVSDLAQISVDDIFKKSGILSLSANLYSFPMWTHYANNARGFAVEFKNLDKCFKGDDTGVLDKLRKVDYNKDRPVLTLDPSDLSEVFFNKLIDWEYEQEYRVVRTFADCEPKSTENGQIYVHQIPSEYIKRIIVGWNVAKDDFEQIKKIVEKECPKISVVQACVEHGLIKTNEEKRVR